MSEPIKRNVDSVVYRRRAAKFHYCESKADGCAKIIHPGDVYLDHTIFPGHDVLDPETVTHLPQCFNCGVRYGNITREGEDNQ